MSHFLKTPRNNLLLPLQAVANIVEKRHTLPILSNVLLEKSGENLTLTATDTDIQVKTSTASEIGSDDGQITVNARKLLDILRALPETADVQLSLEANAQAAAPRSAATDARLTPETGRMSIRAGKARFMLQTLPAADYPRMKIEADSATRILISQQVFKALLDQVAYAMAQQDIRYYLNGLLLVADGSTLRAVATDGHRLAYAETTLENPVAARQEIIIPRKTVQELSRQLADNSEALEVLIGPAQITFRFASIELASKLIDGKFPDYERVIPQALPHMLLLERAAFHDALSRAAILTSDKFPGVRLVLEDKVLKIVTSNSEQEEAQEELEVDANGQAIDIGFNITYLLDVLNHLDSEHIEWHFSDSNSSILITAPDNSHFKYVVMPMRI